MNLVFLEGFVGEGGEFECSPCAGVGFLQVLQFHPTTPTTHIRLIGESELPHSVCDWMMSMPCGELGSCWLMEWASTPPPIPIRNRQQLTDPGLMRMWF